MTYSASAFNKIVFSLWVEILGDFDRVQTMHLVTFFMCLLFLGLGSATILAFEIVDPILSQNGIQYASTGKGETPYDPRWNDFPLKLVMMKGPVKGKESTPYDDVSLQIFTTAQKKLLDLKNIGPWLLVNLPPGDYYIYSQDRRGIDRNITIRVNKKKKKQDLYYIEWPL